MHRAVSLFSILNRHREVAPQMIGKTVERRQKARITNVTCKQNRRCDCSQTRRDFRSNKGTSGAGKGSGDRNQWKLIPSVAIAITDDDDENNHGSQPPMKKTRVSSIPRLRTNKPTSAIAERAGVRLDTKRLLRDVPVPRERFDSNPAGAEEMMGIKFLRNLMRVPVPDDGRHQGNAAKRRIVAAALTALPAMSLSAGSPPPDTTKYASGTSNDDVRDLDEQ